MGTSFGRGAATTSQWDLANSDCVMIMGSNMAENHPVAFRFVTSAQEKGATVIHADPRFTRTSALADLYVPVRAGSDIAFMGGLINYIVNDQRWKSDPFFQEYLVHYTNAATIIRDEFQDVEGRGGIFSGWEPDQNSYQIDAWQYEGMIVPSPLAQSYVQTTESFSDGVRKLTEKPPPEDRTLRDPRCAFQILKRHYANYTPEMVERVTGCPKETFLKVAESLLRNSGRDRTTSWVYAVGWTHHTTGVQMIRGAAIVQSLLGNIGRPGGGIMVMRGHASIQGSTDVPTLYNLLPGYLGQPHALKPHKTLEEYLETEGSPTGWWANFPSYMISLMRAWYGDSVGPENEWGYQRIPKIMGDHSQLPMSLGIANGTIRGLFLMGQNPVVGGLNTRMVTKSLPNLDWMVVRETAENETASFWYASPEAKSGELRPADIKTEIFLLPAAVPGEKEGTFTNTQRLVQWHDKVVDPPADCRSDMWFVFHLGRRLKELYAESTDPKDEAVRNLTWDYPTIGEHQEPSPDAILKEINGYTWPARDQIADPQQLKTDGSTACGVWIYCGAYPRNDFNQTRSRVPDGPDGPGTHMGWAFAWPSNRRILNNRASADPQGRPWSERKKYVWWDEEEQSWVGKDDPDFPKDKPPTYEPDWSREEQKGMDAIRGDAPFILLSDGRANLFAPSGLKDGPLPTHYEPIESPIRNPLYPQQDNPAVKKWDREDNTYHEVAGSEFPYVLTTYRLTEHHTSGMMTRTVPSMAELQPEGFCEIPTELARREEITNLDWVVIRTARGAIEVRALVTDRLRPLEVAGRTIYQIGLPWHYGWQGYATGDVANVLTSVVGDPNTSIHEGKALTCDLRKGRLDREDRR